MQILRRSRHLAAFVLAWFVLSLAAAAAAPALRAAPADWICSAQGSGGSAAAADGLSHPDPGQAASHAGSAHCPLCVLADAPAPTHEGIARHSAPGLRVAIADSAHHRGLAGTLPQSARGPPL